LNKPYEVFEAGDGVLEGEAVFKEEAIGGIGLKEVEEGVGILV